MKRLVFGIALPLLLAAFITAPGTATNAQEKVTLRMANWVGPVHHMTGALKRWAAAVEKESGGTLIIKVDTAPLAAPPGQYDLARQGIADFAWHVFAYTPGRFDVSRGLELPFLSPSAEIGSQAMWDWYSRNIGDKEVNDVKLVTMFVHGPGILHTKKKVTSLADLAGLKIRVGGGGVAIANALGAVPVAMSATQAHESLQRGTTDGVFFPWESIKGFQLVDLVGNHLEIPGGLYTTPFALLMNKENFEKLSPEHQAVIEKWGGANGAKFFGQSWDAADAAGRAAAVANGNNIQTISEAELEKWRAELRVIQSDWVKKVAADGWDGEALLADLRATIERFSASN